MEGEDLLAEVSDDGVGFGPEASIGRGVGQHAREGLARRRGAGDRERTREGHHRAAAGAIPRVSAA